MRRFESFSGYREEEVEVRNFNYLASPACLATLPLPCNLGPIGYREFESSPSANTPSGESLSGRPSPR
jgi:hypothetical protein